MTGSEQEVFRQQIRRLRRRAGDLLKDLNRITTAKARLEIQEATARQKLADLRAELERLAAS